jgi:hypothetical protein
LFLQPTYDLHDLQHHGFLHRYAYRRPTCHAPPALLSRSAPLKSVIRPTKPSSRRTTPRATFSASRL